MTKNVKLTNICPVFLSDDVGRTTEYYVHELGFKYAAHFDKADNFATIYRDSIEIVIVQKKKGTIASNTKRYGNGFDAYIDTDSLKGIDHLYDECLKRNVRIVKSPGMTEYGSYEFVIEDIDGRNIGFGLIANKEIFFENSNLLEQ